MQPLDFRKEKANLDEPTGELPSVESTANLVENQPKAQFRSVGHFVLASVVLMSEGLLVVTEGQLISIGFTGNGQSFDAPYFYTLIRFISRSLAFPLVLLVFWLRALLTRDGRFSIKEFIRASSRLAPGRDFTVKNYLKYYPLPTVSGVGLAIGYMVSLDYIPPAVATACFCSTVALSYIITIAFFKGRHLVLKTAFVLLSFSGVALIAYETSANEAIRDDAYIGIIAILLGCVSLAIHQLFYLKSFPDANAYQVSFIVSVMFATSALIYWPVPLALRLSEYEVWDWATIPWDIVVGAATASLGVAFLYSFGLSISTPFFMSLGELFDTIVMTIVDYIRGFHIGPMQIAGSVIVGVAFCVLILPEEKLSINFRTRSPKNNPVVPEITLTDAGSKNDTEQNGTNDIEPVSRSRSLTPSMIHTYL